ncbi:MAG: Ferredoxin thioredoxin reductase catalytic beta chain [Methanoregula sp. PtaU1.Bin051]|nr:MAG: Ferredoxin thioredoxin reductase catalytic beta chain [Methanoregula sp. PtaU1.Bin051]
MAGDDVSPEQIEKVFLLLERETKAGGYFLNPDSVFVKNLVAGLLKNEKRYGYRACPCRLASGTREDDLDIICPCDYRDSDIEEFGACYCALYVSPAIAAGKGKVAPVPERRPARSLRGVKGASRSAAAPAAGVFPLPIWRCRVCGYLCARDQPPGICPICKATKDRFERFA